jgi:hypothetical protein
LRNRRHLRHGQQLRDAKSAGEIIRCENAGLAVWTAWARGGENGNWAWFDYWNGCIVVKNPDEAILSKMCAIAEKIGARVQGDEGEYYLEHSPKC